VVPLESVGENVVNFSGTQFQAQEASINLLRKSGPLGHFWTRKFCVLTKEKLDEIGATLEHTPQKSLRRLEQETGISESSAATAMKLY
jgi:hypothetical protein